MTREQEIIRRFREAAFKVRWKTSHNGPDGPVRIDRHDATLVELFEVLNDAAHGGNVSGFVTYTDLDDNRRTRYFRGTMAELETIMNTLEAPTWELRHRWDDAFHNIIEENK